jgi:hypothetical protein
MLLTTETTTRGLEWEHCTIKSTRNVLSTQSNVVGVNSTFFDDIP